MDGHINFQTPPQPHSSTGNIPPPHILTSVNKLRSFSTALSAFINHFDELYTHINIINSSIDSILPRHLVDTTNNQSSLTTTSLLEYNCDNIITDCLKVAVSEQNPKGTETDSDKEIDALNKDEETVVGTYCDDQTKTITVVLEDVVSEHNPNGMAINMANITPENEEYMQDYEETDALKKKDDDDQSVLETSCYDQTTDVVVSEQNPNGVVTDCEGRYETVRTIENDEYLQDYGENDALKKAEVVVDVLKKSSEGIDALQKKHEEIDAVMDDEQSVAETYQTITTVVPEAVDLEQKVTNGMAADCERTPENAELLKDCGGSDGLNKLEVVDVWKNCEGFDAVQKYAKTDDLKKDGEAVPESLCDQTINDVSDVVVSEQNANGMDTDLEQKHVNVRTAYSLDEIEVIDVSKQPEQTDILNKHKEVDIRKNLEGTVVLKESEELDTLMIPKEIDETEETVPNTSCDQIITTVAEAIVSEQNTNGIDACGEQSRENVRISDSLDESDILKKPEELDTSVIPEEIDTSKKPVETVAETSCGQTTPVVPVAIVTEQNPNRSRTAANREQRHENVSKKVTVVDISKKPKQTGVLKKPEQTDICKNPKEIIVLKKHREIDTLKNRQEIDTSKNRQEIDSLKKRVETGIRKKAKETEASKKSVISTLEYLCQSMNSKELKRHVAAHFSEMIDLRKEISKALKLAEDPAKLVLNSIGRFFVQGSRTFCEGLGSHQDMQALGRKAAVLILECFVMISSCGIEIAKRDQEYAAQAAFDWRNRMIREGRLRHADEVDARGLLLLISGFGIQDRVFKIQDILDLIRASNWKGISAALRCSDFLVRKIPDVIDLMVKNNLHIEAADIAYTFGLEDECHPRSILASFLRKYIRNIQKGSNFQTLEEMKQQLLDLKDVKHCLISHNIDPSMYLPDFKINKEIQNLEKEVYDAKRTQKRKSLENPIHQEAKRACFGHEKRPRHQSPADHHGKNRCYRSTRPSIGYFDPDPNLHNSYITNCSPSFVYNTPVVRETVTSPVPIGRASGFPGSYDHMRHSPNAQPYGCHDPHVQHYSRHGQTYDCIGRRGPSSALYGFADIVERGIRRFHA